MPESIPLKIALYGFFKGDEPGSFKIDRVIPNEVGTELKPDDSLRGQIKAVVAILILQSTNQKSLKFDELLAEPNSLIAFKNDGTIIDIDKPLRDAALPHDPTVHVLLNERGYPPHIAAKLMAYPLAEITAAPAPEWDIFISHASEDKDFVRPLAEILSARGLRIWLGEVNLTVGDSLNRKIEAALSRSRFGVVVISPSFLRKEWPRRELDGLTAREHGGSKVILPVWHGVKFEDVQKCSPMLAGRLAVNSDRGVDHVVDELLRAVRASAPNTGLAADA